MKTTRTQTQTHVIRHHRERGAVLVISLVMLLVLTVLAVSALTNTSLEEKMARNFQQSMTVFQAAESAIEKVVMAGHPREAGVNDNPFYVAADDPLQTAFNAGEGDTSTVVTYDMDPDGHLTNTTLNTTATVVYTGGSTMCTETSEKLLCESVDVQAEADIDATSAHARHIQSLAFVVPNPDK